MELFNLMQVSVQDIILVCAIAETGSVSQAAAKVRLSQSTASYRLNKLRDIFSDSIFVSTNRRMIPTAKGLRLVAAFEEQIKSLNMLVEPEEFDPMVSHRSFNILAQGFQFSSLMTYLPKVFFGQTRHAKLNIDISDMNESLGPRLRDNVDFAAMHFQAAEGGKGLRRFVSPELKVVVYYDPIMRDAPKTVEEYFNCRFVMLDSLKTVPSLFSKKTDLKDHAAREVVSYASNAESMAHFIKGTDLVFVGTGYTFNYNANGLVYSDIPFATKPIRHEICWNIAKEDDEGHSWLRQIMIQSFKKNLLPTYRVDPTEEFSLLTEFERL